jgi:hypothetical protein
MNSPLNLHSQHQIVDAVSHEARMQTAHFHAVISEPFTRLRPKIFIDGNMWCALYGETLQDGVAGFGKSPAEAEQAFNAAWGTALAAARGEVIHE